MSVQYTGVYSTLGGCSVHHEEIISTVGGEYIMSTLGDVQYTGGYHEYTRGYHDKCGERSLVFPFNT